MDVDIDFQPGFAAQVAAAIVPGETMFAPIGAWSTVRRAAAPLPPEICIADDARSFHTGLIRAVHYDNFDATGRVYSDSPAGWATMGTGLVGAYADRRIGCAFRMARRQLISPTLGRDEHGAGIQRGHGCAPGRRLRRRILYGCARMGGHRLLLWLADARAALCSLSVRGISPLLLQALQILPQIYAPCLGTWFAVQTPWCMLRIPGKVPGLRAARSRRRRRCRASGAARLHW